MHHSMSPQAFLINENSISSQSKHLHLTSRGVSWLMQNFISLHFKFSSLTPIYINKHSVPDQSNFNTLRRRNTNFLMFCPLKHNTISLMQLLCKCISETLATKAQTNNKATILFYVQLKCRFTFMAKLFPQPLYAQLKGFLPSWSPST